MLPDGLVDLHCHVLPGLDDGPRDERETLAMLRAAVDDGISTVVATPHAHHAGANTTLEAVERANLLARESGLPIHVLPGHEARLSSDLIEQVATSEVLTLNRHGYLLVEWPYTEQWPVQVVERTTTRLLDAGLRLVLAHAERSRVVQQRPEVLEALVARGVIVQLNAASLTGYEGERAREVAELLLRRRLAHVIASDAHNAQYRPPRLHFAYELAGQLAGPDYAAWLCQVPPLVIAGEVVSLPAPECSGSCNIDL
jgi:protein-tyrosine phosphatase